MLQGSCSVSISISISQGNPLVLVFVLVLTVSLPGPTEGSWCAIPHWSGHIILITGTRYKIYYCSVSVSILLELRFVRVRSSPDYLKRTWPDGGELVCDDAPAGRNPRADIYIYIKWALVFQLLL